MPEMTVPRPVLRSFRVLALNGQNKGDGASAKMQLTVQQDIEVGFAVPSVAGAPLMAGVIIKLQATATNEKDANDVATFGGEYEAKFFYSTDVTEAVVTPLLDDHGYQYVLVAQAFPLAMTHFRHELQAMGLDARELPLGLE